MAETPSVSVTELYTELLKLLKRANALGSVMDVLGWDERVNLPPAPSAAEKRAEQSSIMAEERHKASTHPRIGEILTELEKDLWILTDDQKIVLRETRKEYDRMFKIPNEFVSRKAAAESKAYHAWAAARKDSNFAKFEPHLNSMLDLAKEEAKYLGFTGDKAYDYFLDRFDPGLTVEVLDKVFVPLREQLVPLVKEILALATPKKSSIPDSALSGWPIESQIQFSKEIIKAMGFDLERGMLSVSVHPFTCGDQADTRITTRFAGCTSLSTIASSMHEAGHGIYEQGLSLEDRGTVLGEAVGMAIHESQSRIWENQVGRSKEWWSYWEPKFRSTFPEQMRNVNSEELMKIVKSVRINPIRVESDEVTYNLHILLRYEIEKRMFKGDVDIHELPALWNKLCEEIVGMKPENDAQGVLQDVHWSGAMFGYFPSYTLGNLISAQLWERAQDELPTLKEDIANGRYLPFRDWLREKIHKWGKRYDTVELTKRATGLDLAPDAFIRYLKERYLKFYK